MEESDSRAINGTGFPSDRVIRVLNHLEEELGLPKAIRVDNGPEFISIKFQKWCKEKSIEIKYIQPGSPAQNAFIERFNRYFIFQRPSIHEMFRFGNRFKNLVDGSFYSQIVIDHKTFILYLSLFNFVINQRVFKY